MRLKLIITSLLISLSLTDSAFGQICSVSEYPYGFASINYPRMHGSHFKDLTKDLPFVARNERKPRYSQSWINTDVLNVRTGPGPEYNIKSRTYFGNLVFAYAKTGDWVAIDRDYSYDGVNIEPKWVHIKYLSADRIRKQVGIDVLKKQCSFRQYGESSIEQQLYDAQNNIFNACGAVTNYLTQQKLLSKTHEYYDDYYNWRSSQGNPESYRSLPCDIQR